MRSMDCGFRGCIAEVVAGGLHGFAAHGRGDGLVHHEFGEAMGGFVEVRCGLTDSLEVVARLNDDQVVASGVNRGNFPGGQQAPGGVFRCFGAVGQDGIGLEAGLDDLASRKYKCSCGS